MSRVVSVRLLKKRRGVGRSGRRGGAEVGRGLGGGGRKVQESEVVGGWEGSGGWEEGGGGCGPSGFNI